MLSLRKKKGEETVCLHAADAAAGQPNLLILAQAAGGPWRTLLLHRPNPGDPIDTASVPSAPRQDYTVHWAKKSSSTAD